LCLHEAHFDYKSMQRSFTIAINYADHIYRLKGADRRNFFENTIVSMRYLLDISIWDILIRQGLINRTVEISPFQKERIVFPVLSNDNKNLLHIFSVNNFEAL
jgi:hypothetical protein